MRERTRRVCYGDTTILESLTEWSGYEWNTGETTRSIEYIVLKDSTFMLTVTDSIGCTDEDEVIITTLDLPLVDLGDDVTICPGTSYTLNTGTGFSYLWSDQSTSQTLDVSEEDTYWVRITDGNGCRNYDTVDVTLHIQPVVDLGDDITVCPDEEAILDAGPGFASYLWSDGSAEAEIYVKETGAYSLTATDSYGCTTTSEEIMVTKNPVPVLDLGPDMEHCEGEYIILDPGPDYATYNWNDGLKDTQTFEAYYSGVYTLTVTNEYGCAAYDEINVTYISPQVVDLGEDTGFCTGSEIYLTPSTGFYSYLWSDGSTGQGINVDEPGTYWVEVLDGNGCTSFDTINIVEYDLPEVNLGNDTSYCDSDSYYILDAGT